MYLFFVVNFSVYTLSTLSTNLIIMGDSNVNILDDATATPD